LRTHYERSIDVCAPVRTAYACWERDQDFPGFVRSLAEVRPLAPDRIHWRARVAGIDREWTAEVTERSPDRRIAWCSRSGTPNAGCVTFHAIGADRGAGRTRVMLQVDYRPDGWVVAAGDLLRVPQICLDAALEGFKQYVEGRSADGDPLPAVSVAPPLPAPAPPSPCVPGVEPEVAPGA
jgi:uncharacterized membrane protein